MKTTTIFLLLLSVLVFVAASPIRPSSHRTTRTLHPLTNTRLHTITSLTHLTGTRTTALIETTPAVTLAVRGETHLTDEEREACLDDCDDTCLLYGACSDETWDKHLSGVGASHTAWLNSVLSSHSAEMREQTTKTEEGEVVARATGLA
jgi:hypothetical protein